MFSCSGQFYTYTLPRCWSHFVTILLCAINLVFKTIVYKDLPMLRTIVYKDLPMLRTIVYKDLPMLRTTIICDTQFDELTS